MALPLAVCEGRDGSPRPRWVSAVELGEQLRKLPTSGMVVESPDEVVARDNQKEKEQKSDLAAFQAFWEQLSGEAQGAFEGEALTQADRNKLRWYEDARSDGRGTAEYFRQAILNDPYRKECSAE